MLVRLVLFHSTISHVISSLSILTLTNEIGIVFFVRQTQHLKKTLNVVGVYIAYYKGVSLSLVRLTSRFGSLRESPAGGYCSGNIN